MTVTCCHVQVYQLESVKQQGCQRLQITEKKSKFKSIAHPSSKSDFCYTLWSPYWFSRLICVFKSFVPKNDALGDHVILFEPKHRVNCTRHDFLTRQEKNQPVVITRTGQSRKEFRYIWWSHVTGLSGFRFRGVMIKPS